MEKAAILKMLQSTIWALLPEKLETLNLIGSHLASGADVTEEDAREFLGAKKITLRKTAGNVGVLPLYGFIEYRPSWISKYGYGTSVLSFKNDLQNMLSDPTVGAIVIDTDSPGGTVEGVDELSQFIYESRGQKPIIAVSTPMMASAAYYIASAADQVAVMPTGEVGSIGVWMMHSDYSKAFEDAGITNTIIRAGKFKAEGNPYEPLSPEAKGAMQKDVDTHYDMFVKAVARNRNVSVSEVKDGFGQGRMVMAREAVSMGMADEVVSLEEILTRAGGSNTSTRRASEEDPAPTADEPDYELRARLLGL